MHDLKNNIRSSLHRRCILSSLSDGQLDREIINTNTNSIANLELMLCNRLAIKCAVLAYGATTQPQQPSFSCYKVANNHPFINMQNLPLKLIINL